MSTCHPVLLVLSLLLVPFVLQATEFPKPLWHESNRVLSQLDGTHDGRALLQRDARAESRASADGVGRCTWNRRESTCEVSLAASAEYLSNSNNEFGQFIAQFAECGAMEDEESCRELRRCLWSNVHDGCLFINFAEGHDDSPCVKAAPLTIASLQAVVTCTEHANQLQCLSDPNCFWNSDLRFCRPSASQIFFDLPHDFTVEFANSVVEYKTGQIMGSFQSDFDTDDPAFDWTTVLGWEAPDTDCPEWSHEVVCAMADGIMQNVSVILYCNGRYSEPTQREECFEDPLCDYSTESFTCGASFEILEIGEMNGLGTVVPSIGAPVDREVAGQWVDCRKRQDEESCTGNCGWNAVLQQCMIGFEWGVRRVAEAGTEFADPVCLFMETYETSGCFDSTDLDACRRNPDCHVLGGVFCVATEEYLVKTVVAESSDLEDSYSQLQEDCSSFESRRACNNA